MQTRPQNSQHQSPSSLIVGEQMGESRDDLAALCRTADKLGVAVETLSREIVQNFCFFQATIFHMNNAMGDIENPIIVGYKQNRAALLTG